MDKVSWNESRHVYRYVEYWIRQSEEAASHEKRQHCECGDSDQTLPTLVQRQRFQACESSLVKKSRHVTGYHAVVGDGSCPRRASTLCWSSNPDWPWLPMGYLEYTSSNLLGGG